MSPAIATALRAFPSGAAVPFLELPREVVDAIDALIGERLAEHRGDQRYALTELGERRKAEVTP